MWRPQHNLKKSSGIVTVEFALVLPLLLLLLLGIIEFSILLYDKAIITNASREGARAAIVYDVNESGQRVYAYDIAQVVNSYCSDNLISFGNSALSVSYPSDPPGSGQEITVQVDYQYDFLLLPNRITQLNDTIELSAQTVMLAE